MSTRTENWKPLEFHCPYECTYCPESEMGYSKTPRLREGWMDIPSYSAIWVCPDTDLFSEEVPSSLIESILKRASQYPDKTFVFCTRNVKRYLEFLGKFPPWTLFATTIESDINYGCSKAPSPMVRLEELKKLRYALDDHMRRGETCISIKPIMKFTDKFADMIRNVLPDQIAIGKDVMGIENFPTPLFSEVLTLAKKLLAFTQVNIHGCHVSKSTCLEDWPYDKEIPERFEIKDRRYLRAAYQVPEGVKMAKRYSLAKQALAKRVITEYYPSYAREFYPHGGAKSWNWACSICGLVYERQTDAQVCCYQEKYDRGWAWREPKGQKPKNKPIGD